jgi:hypothetical protein
VSISGSHLGSENKTIMGKTGISLDGDSKQVQSGMLLCFLVTNLRNSHAREAILELRI